MHDSELVEVLGPIVEGRTGSHQKLHVIQSDPPFVEAVGSIPGSAQQTQLHPGGRLLDYHLERAVSGAVATGLRGTKESPVPRGAAICVVDGEDDDDLAGERWLHLISLVPARHQIP